jgi:hypothetical protein
MPRKGFEPTIPAFERAKTLHALDRAATVIGRLVTKCINFKLKMSPLSLLQVFQCESPHRITILQKTNAPD